MLTLKHRSACVLRGSGGPGTSTRRCGAFFFTMENCSFNNRRSRASEGSVQVDEAFSRNDAIKLLNMVMAEVTHNRLDIKTQIGELVGTEQEKIDIAVATGIVSHLMYLGQRVGCEIAKPFLPYQADDELKISVQTPITAHIMECQDCRNDIDIINELELSQQQIVRLGQLFTEVNHKDTVDCVEAQKAMRSVAELDFGATTADVLKHLCLCQNCRELLYQERKTILESLSVCNLSQGFSCELVSMVEVFDCCVPFDFDATGERRLEIDPSLMSHLSKCPRCLGEMQRLHNTIYAILKRPESGIVTCYWADELKKSPS